LNEEEDEKKTKQLIKELQIQDEKERIEKALEKEKGFSANLNCSICFLPLLEDKNNLWGLKTCGDCWHKDCLKTYMEAKV